MNIIVDSNGIYDYIAERYPHYGYAEALLSLRIQKKVKIFVCATTISNGFYIFRKFDLEEVKNHFQVIMDHYMVLPLDEQVLQSAMGSSFHDLEDACIEQSALLHGDNITHLVTRNQKDFTESRLKVVSAKEMIDLLTL